jgi:hypothetical protein
MQFHLSSAAHWQAQRMGAARVPWPSQGGALSAVVVTSENSAEFYAKRLGLDAPEPAAAAEVTAEPAVESAARPSLAPRRPKRRAAGKRPNPRKVEGPPPFFRADRARRSKPRPTPRKRATSQGRPRARRAGGTTGSGASSEVRAPETGRVGPRAHARAVRDDEDFALALKDWAGESAIRERDQKERRREDRARVERAPGRHRAEVPDYDAVIAAGPTSWCPTKCGTPFSRASRVRRSCTTSRRIPTSSKSSSARRAPRSSDRTLDAKFVKAEKPKRPRARRKSSPRSLLPPRRKFPERRHRSAR